MYYMETNYRLMGLNKFTVVFTGFISCTGANTGYVSLLRITSSERDVYDYVIANHILFILKETTPSREPKHFVSFLLHQKERFMLEWQNMKTECLLMKTSNVAPATNHEKPLLRMFRTIPHFGCHFVNELVNIQQITHNELYGRVCDPKRTAMEKYIFAHGITVNKIFHLYLMFEKFEFLADYACYNEHLTLKSVSPVYPFMVFCGKRNPWEIFYTTNVLKIFAVGEIRSKFQVFFHVTSSHNFRYFHVCPDPCPDTNYCRMGNILENMILSLTDNAIDFFLTNKLYVEGRGQIGIFNVKGPKYLILCLCLRLKNMTFSVHDGPGINSPQLKFEKGDLKLSTFQGTLLVPLLHMHKNVKRGVLFYSKEDSAVQRPKLIDHPSTLNFSFSKSDPTTLCVKWFSQPPDMSINIVVEEVNYTGPEESREITCYGGLAVYFIDESGGNEEMLHLSHTFFRYSSDRQRHRRKEYMIVTKLDTNFVVIVHYFYASYAFLSSNLVLSPTYCVGHYVSTSHCAQNVEIVDQPSSGNYSLLQMRSTHKCAVISMFNNLLSVGDFTIYNKYQQFCPDPLLTHKLYISLRAHQNYLKEIQYFGFMYWHSLAVNSGSELFFHDMINLDRRTTKKFTTTFTSARSATNLQSYFASVKNGVDLHTFDQLLVYTRAFDGGYFPQNDISSIFSPVIDHLFYAWASLAINIISPENPVLIKSLLSASNIFVPFCPRSVVSFICGPPQKMQMLQQNILKCNTPPQKVGFANKLLCPSCSFHDIRADSTAVYLKFQNSTFTQTTFLYAIVPEMNTTFSFTLSNTNTHILIPSTSFPKCSWCKMNVNDHTLSLVSSMGHLPAIRMCETVHILLHPSNTITQQNISLIHVKHRNSSEIPSHVLIIPQWKIQEKLSCFATLISWNDAFADSKTFICHQFTVKKMSKFCLTKLKYFSQKYHSISSKVTPAKAKTLSIQVQKYCTKLLVSLLVCILRYLFCSNCCSVQKTVKLVSADLFLYFQNDKHFWTNGYPVAVSYESIEEEDSMRVSWTIYMKYISWYFETVKQDSPHFQHLRGEHTLQFHNKSLMWEVVSGVWAKVQRIGKVFQQGVNVNATEQSCTLLLVWNRFFIKWIKISCDEKLLDKSAFYCANTSKPNAVHHNNPNNVSRTENIFDMPKHISNVFTCFEDHYISVKTLCNSKSDCYFGDEKFICVQQIFQLSLEKWLNFRFAHIIHISEEANLTKIVAGNTKKQTTLESYNCSSKGAKCKYDIQDQNKNMTLKYCNNGSNLVSCENYECGKMFKCLGYYCLPWKYVCDGYWDCPAGYDEDDCFRKPKPGFFHCTNTSIHILPESVCDGKEDCPNGNEEILCDLKNSHCPFGCLCIVYHVLCNHTKILSRGPFRYLHVSYTTNADRTTYLQVYFQNLVLIRITKTNIEHISSVFPNRMNLVNIFLCTENKLNSVSTKIFVHTPNVQCISFSHNNLSTLPCGLFSGINQVSSLVLSFNRFVELRNCYFQNLLSLKFVNLFGNSIESIQEPNFRRNVIVNSSFMGFLCIKNSQLTTNLTPETNFCKSLLLKQVIAILAMVCGGLLCFSNAVSFKPVFFPSKRSTNEGKKVYQYFVQYVSSSNIQYGSFLIVISSLDLFHGQSIALFEATWRKGLFCHMLYFLFTLSVISLPVSVLSLAVCRLMVIWYPMETKFKQTWFAKKLILVLNTVCVLFALVSTLGAHFLLSSFPRLCIPITAEGPFHSQPLQ